MAIGNEVEELLKEKNIHRDYHDPNGYNIRCGYPYPIHRTDTADGRTYYSIKCKTKYADDAFKQISFYTEDRKTPNYPDGTLIRPLKMVENHYFYKGIKYIPIFTLTILDWEVVKSKADEKKELREDYSKTVLLESLNYEDEDLPF